MQGIDVSYSDEVGFLTKGDRDWEDWIMQLLLMAKKGNRQGQCPGNEHQLR